MRKIIYNVFWLLCEHGSKIAVTIVISSVLARQLGVEQYGLFQYALSLVMVFMSISFICGSEVLVPRLVNASSTEQKNILGNAFVIRLFFSTLAYIGLILFSFFTDTQEQLYLTITLGVVLLLNESFGVIAAWLQSQTNSKPRSLVFILAFLLKTSWVIGLYLFNIYNPIYYALAWVLESSVVAIGLLGVYRHINKSFFFAVNWGDTLDLLRSGLPFFYGLVLMYVFLRIDTILLKSLSDLKTLGLYAASAQIVTAIVSFATILSVSIAPTFVYAQHDFKLIKKNVIYIVILMLFVGIVSALFINFLAPWIIPLLFGANFIEAIPILFWFLWASVLFFIDSGLNLLIIKIQKGRLFFYKWLSVLSVSAIVHLIAIPHYHAYGAIMGYVSGYIVACIFGLICLNYYSEGTLGGKLMKK